MVHLQNEGMHLSRSPASGRPGWKIWLADKKKIAKSHTYLHSSHGQEGLEQERDAPAAAPLISWLTLVPSASSRAPVPVPAKASRVIVVAVFAVPTAPAVHLLLLAQAGAGYAVIGREHLPPVGDVATPAEHAVHKLAGTQTDTQYARCCLLALRGFRRESVQVTVLSSVECSPWSPSCLYSSCRACTGRHRPGLAAAAAALGRPVQGQVSC